VLYLHLAVSVVTGYMMSVIAWLAARRFVAKYQAATVPVRSDPLRFRDPRGAISPVVAVIQASGVLFGAYIWWRQPEVGQVVAALVVTGILMTLSLVDMTVHRIPNVLSLALLVWGLVQVAWLGYPTPQGALLGLLVGGGLFLLIAIVGRGAMGAGDVKLAAALGAVLGYPLIVSALLWGIIAGGVAALLLMATRRIGRKDYMAYGPYLALGAWVIWLGAFGLWP